MSFGILAFGHALGTSMDVAGILPPESDDAARRDLDAKGYRRIFRADDGVGISDLAVEAAAAALAKAEVRPAQVDLLVMAISDLAEYLYWDVAAAVQARLGAHRAEALLMNQACSAGVLAFDTVAGKLATHPGYRTAVVVTANRVCESYWDRAETGTSLSSDGAAAVVLRRDHPECRWLLTEVISDGRYADFMRMDVGGTARPFAPGGPRPAVGALVDRMDAFFKGDGQAAYRLSTTMKARNRVVLERACERAGVPVDSIARVLYLNDNISAFTALTEELAVPLDRTNAEFAMDHGHFGTADQLLCLERHLENGELKPGDIVALLSMGSGMHWACTLLTV
ncbi:3-oxoacyl-[acyl-carrier-protein] synthase III C-terminal domain-containing protein [Microbispora sp. NPDC046973]|uniref:3-oxoacyl-ACP synthase III family protein n=1 Tax=Microbispora sp. NPDC046973 TaxID=3155022 RepID=UPI0033FA5604